MKKLTIATIFGASILLSNSVAAAATEQKAGSANFQWTGTIPALVVNGTGYKIVNAGTLDFSKGALSFENNGTNILVNDSSELSFKVVADGDASDYNGDGTAAADKANLGYSYTLTNITAAIGGGFAGATTGFMLQANGGDIELNSAKTVTSTNNVTRLKLKKQDTGLSPEKDGGKEVIIQAAILIDNITDPV
ncbi:hypothetical protein [Vibrio cionasavignyae]|uniref:hypothetical protein n=1 Tax=Vibrio cionasavignyae TaxID=2910252 RepID=UPI003D0DF84A